MTVIDLPMIPTLSRGVKWSFVTRRVARADALGLRADLTAAKAGDLVLARVMQIGSHKRVQLSSGRPSTLYEGDLLMLAAGARYAADQFEGVAELDATGADMLAGGGIVGRMRHRNARISGPTRVMPLGLICDRDGAVLNLARYALASPRPEVMLPAASMPVIAALGASMNAGKTTAVAALANGLVGAGHRVAAIKVTGTGAFGDVNAYHDAGAHVVADFVDAGMATTYREPLARIEAATRLLLGRAGAAGADVAVIEYADGIFQAETAALIRRPENRALIDAIIFAAPDAASVVGGLGVLENLGVLPLVVTGLVSRSPLACSEAETMTGIPVTATQALSDPALATALRRRALAARTAHEAEAGGVTAGEAVPADPPLCPGSGLAA
ncbi:MAG: DUF1611 domain-containing protein [Pseudomonadota bacterium]